MNRIFSIYIMNIFHKVEAKSQKVTFYIAQNNASEEQFNETLILRF